MKNLYLVPTNKASMLIGNNKGFIIIKETDKSIHNYLDLIQAKYYNIYVTDDSELKEGWYFNNAIAVYKCVIAEGEDHIKGLKKIYGNKPRHLKKIILTTDQELIKDGIQPIDEDFLEWFVNNPTCESVEVEKDEFYSKKAFIEGKDAITYKYKIIIPRKPKQETLEEASFRTLEEVAFRLYPRLINDPYNPIEDDNKESRDIWIAGAKWQQAQDKNKYSEENIENIWNEFVKELPPINNGSSSDFLH
jgi:hypothetical protein